MKSTANKKSTLSGFLENLSFPKLSEARDDLSASGILAMQELDFPTRKSEAWKYTRTAKISKLQLKEGNAGSVNTSPLVEDSVQIIFSNGHIAGDSPQSTDLSNGILAADLLSAMEKYPELVEKYIGKAIPANKNVFTAINAAGYQNGLFLYIPKNTHFDRTVEVVLHCNQKNTLQNIRNLIILEEGASASVVFRVMVDNSDDSLLNACTEMFLGKNSSLDVDKLQLENENIYQTFHEEAHQERDSKFDIRTFIKKSDWIRNDLSIRLNGENTETHLSGAYYLVNKEHADNHTTVDHKVPHCVSNELYKGIMDDKSTGVFNGKVFVREDAQKTEAYQSNGNILLSDDATINSKPELEIYADDVRCSHGSTTGQFDEEAVFYLKSRGLGDESAYQLLTSAFLGEVVEKVKNTAVRNAIIRKMELDDTLLDME